MKSTDSGSPPAASTPPPPLRPVREPVTLLVTGAAVADGRGVLGAPGAVLVRVGPGEHPFILAIGRERDVRGHEAARAGAVIEVTRPGSVIIPGLVNAHTHLDLTHIGPRPHDPEHGFVAWVDVIRAGRCTDEAGIAASVRRGIELSIAGGTAAIGDIAGAPRGVPSLTPWRVMRESPLLGASFLEFFAIGTGRERGMAAIERVVREGEAEIEESGRVRLGIQPHAPNTVSPRGYRRAIELARPRGLPLCTHLAETVEEREFVAHATGPQRALLERLGAWDESILEDVGHGRHPVSHLAPVLREARFAIAHVNDCDDAAIETLARTKATVVYCPRASAYFGAERRFGPHRYRDLLAAGVPVALGTDSIVNLPAPAADPAAGGMSILDEMRLLSRRDGTPPTTLLRMATTLGAAAIGVEPGLFELREERPAEALLAVPTGLHAGESADPLGSMLMRDGRPEFLCIGSRSGLTEIQTAS